MKILLLGSGKVKYMPYMNFYLDCIDTKQHETHLIFWNNDDKKEDVSFLKNVCLHEYTYYQEDEVSLFSKVRGYLGFRHFVNSILAQQKFDIIVVLHSITGVVVFDKLMSYKGKYIFDYRDSTYEWFYPFKFLIGQMVKKSCITFVSSDGFRKFLPDKYKDKIVTSHNLLVDSLLHSNDKEQKGTTSSKIRIAFWGFIRHEEVNRTFIKLVSKDSRFELHYYGREQQTALNLKQYVAENNIGNVFFHGEYVPEDRYSFILDTDIIDNIYYDPNSLLAMGNKYYDSVIFKIPQICMNDSYMGKMAEEAHVGITCDPNDNTMLDKVFSYYKNLNLLEFRKSCELEQNRILNEYNQGVDILKHIFSGS